MIPLITRRLGRTERQVTTMGLGGQASIQWTGKGIDPIAIIEKAYRIGINYMDTSNVYGPSQKNYGEAFRGLGLSPAASNYDPAARKKIFLATKTHFRSARQPHGDRFRTDFSDGMTDGFNVASSVDDVRRSLSLMFGDGKGGYPEGAYLDSIQFHNLNTQDEVDMLFEGFDDPTPDARMDGFFSGHAGSSRRNEPDRSEPQKGKAGPAHRHHRPLEHSSPHVRHPTG